LGPLGDPTLPWFPVSGFRSPVSSPPLRAPASLREIPFSPIRGDLRHSRALSALRVSLCTAEDCHGYNKFSPWLCASVRAPSNFLPFAGPKPQKNLPPAIEQIPPTTTVGGTPTLLEPPSAPLRVASLLRYAPVAPLGYTFVFPFGHALSRGCSRHSRAPTSPTGLRFAQSVPLRGARTSFSSHTHVLGIRFADCMAERVGLIQAFGLHPSGAALRAVCAASRRSNFVLIPHPCFRNPLRGLHGGEGGIDSGLRPSPLRGCASRSLCRFAALELRSHPTPMF
jgi:hypothetical protein